MDEDGGNGSRGAEDVHEGAGREGEGEVGGARDEAGSLTWLRLRRRCGSVLERLERPHRVRHAAPRFTSPLTAPVEPTRTMGVRCMAAATQQTAAMM